MTEEQVDVFTFGLNTMVNDSGKPEGNGGQGEIRTRDFCLAKAAIYRADLLAHDESGNSPNAITHLKMMAGPGDGAVIRTALAPQPPPSRL